MNDVKISGRLTKDPIVTYTANSKVVAQFTLAINRPPVKKDDSNLQQQAQDKPKTEADFVPVVFWGKLAELIGNTLKKGSKIFVDGRIRVRSYDGKDGVKHWVTEVVGRHFEYMESKPVAQAESAEASSFEAFGKEEPIPFSASFEEEIPF